MEIIVGAKGNVIDRIEVENIIKKFKQKYPYIQFKLKELNKNMGEEETSGNIQEDQLEEMLIKGKIDILIQDMKSFNTSLSHKLAINSIVCREDARDGYILPWPYKCIEELPSEAKIVVSNERSYLQVKDIRSDIKISIMQSSILQELKNMDTGKLDGIILTASEAKINGVLNRMSGYFPVNQIVPAPNEGIWGLETHRHHYILNQIVANLHDMKTGDAASIERRFCKMIRQQDGVPLGAYCDITEKHVQVIGVIYSKSQERCVKMELCGPTGCEEELVNQIINRLLHHK